VRPVSFSRRASKGGKDRAKGARVLRLLYVVRQIAASFEDIMQDALTMRVGGQLRSLQIATIRTLHADELTGVDLKGRSCADALVFDATPRLLAAAKRTSGLRCASGRVQVEKVALGMLLIAAEDEGHAVLFPMAAPEVISLQSDAERRGTWLALASAPAGEAKLIVVDAAALESLRQARSMGESGKPQAALAALAVASRFLLSAPAAQSLPSAFAALGRVVVHALLPASLGMERCEELVKDETNVSLH
jgi:hypothetical protein